MCSLLRHSNGNAAKIIKPKMISVNSLEPASG